jgi:hypothetical protein
MCLLLKDARHPSVSHDELVRATAELRALGDDAPGSDIKATDGLVPVAELLTLVACLAPVFAFASRGSFWLRLLGVAMVTVDGAEASRRLAVWRAFVTWSPMWLLAVCVAGSGRGIPFDPFDDAGFAAHGVAMILAVGLLLVCAMWAVVHPARGFQDRIAGTWLVPR